MAGRRRRVRGWAIGIGALALLAALSAVDPSGLRKYSGLAHEAERMAAENAHLAEENARFAREVRALRTDPTALERAAREELRLVRPGERVYWAGERPEADP